ncbi:MAG: PLDc N-terminal domain-containing protein [Proteobacteria bacterium]|nr:PLDc N-terminal domain-containing protein [Pseudomonadota bacterium]
MLPMSTSFITLAITLLHTALALAVTAHALRTQRNPGSAVAWIGLAWLSPVLGSVVYALLGVNRVQRRARARGMRPAAMRQAHCEPAPCPSAHLDALEAAAFRLTGRQVETGNQIDMFENGDEAYPRMLAAINAATRSVALSSYIFRADAAGVPFIEALTAAHRRGAQVRVLIDGVGGGYLGSGAFRRLRRAGVPCARFMHSLLPWRMPFLNLRTHRKLLIVDGATAFMGGLNIGGENLIAAHPRHPVLDTHFSVRGPVVGQLGDAFAEQWYFATGESLSGDVWFPALEPVGEACARVVTSGPDQDLEKIELLILAAIGCARTSIRVMTPYFLPDDRLITALALAAMRGVGVDIVLPARTNHPSVDWAMRAHVGPLLAAGCRVWAHAAPFNHAKLMSVDGLWCLIGSANWDTRSFRLNFEVDLEAYHAPTVTRVSEKIAAHQTVLLTAKQLAARSWATLTRDQAARLLMPYL